MKVDTEIIRALDNAAYIPYLGPTTAKGCKSKDNTADSSCRRT